MSTDSENCPIGLLPYPEKILDRTYLTFFRNMNYGIVSVC